MKTRIHLKDKGIIPGSIVVSGVDPKRVSIDGNVVTVSVPKKKRSKQRKMLWAGCLSLTGLVDNVPSCCTLDKTMRSPALGPYFICHKDGIYLVLPKEFTDEFIEEGCTFKSYVAGKSIFFISTRRRDVELWLQGVKSACTQMSNWCSGFEGSD